MTRTSTVRPATTCDPWDESLWDESEEAKGPSWSKSYNGGFKHREYSTIDGTN